MLTLLYFVVIALPLTLAALALLVIALRVTAERMGTGERRPAKPPPRTPLATPPSAATLGDLHHRSWGRSLRAALDVDTDADPRDRRRGIGAPAPVVPRAAEITPAGRALAAMYAAAPAAAPPASPIAPVPAAALAATSLTRPSLAAVPPSPPLADPSPHALSPFPPGVPTKACPDCAETVLAAARICRYCRLRFTGDGELFARPPLRDAAGA